VNRPPPAVALPTAAFVVVFRWWYFLALGALVALVFGGGDLVVALGSSSEPVAVDLAAIERDGPPAERFLRVGEHMALLDHAILLRKKGSARAPAGAPPPAIDHVLYPIASLHHPYVAAWQALDAQYASRADVPLGKVPHPDGLLVFVRAPSLPAHAGGTPLLHREQLVGLARPWTLVTANGTERSALAARMPGLDLDRVLILDADLQPPSLEGAITTIALGLLFAVLGVQRFRRGRRTPVTPAPTS
jgi:hypothetical protein